MLPLLLLLLLLLLLPLLKPPPRHRLKENGDWLLLMVQVRSFDAIAAAAADASIDCAGVLVDALIGLAFALGWWWLWWWRLRRCSW